MNISKDLKQARKDGLLTYPEAWELHEGRIDLKRETGKYHTAQLKAEVQLAVVDGITSRLTPLELKLAGGPVATATEPREDDEDGVGAV